MRPTPCRLSGAREVPASPVASISGGDHEWAECLLRVDFVEEVLKRTYPCQRDRKILICAGLKSASGRIFPLPRTLSTKSVRIGHSQPLCAGSAMPPDTDISVSVSAMRRSRHRGHARLKGGRDCSFLRAGRISMRQCGVSGGDGVRANRTQSGTIPLQNPRPAPVSQPSVKLLGNLWKVG